MDAGGTILTGLVVAGGVACALAAPALARAVPRVAGWLLALVPLLLAAAILVGRGDGPPPTLVVPWIPALQVTVALRLDGLATLFGLTVLGVAAPVFAFAGAYLRGDPRLGGFLALLSLFMAAMLGLVLADDLLFLYVCWELTTICSWLLVGFDHERAEARAGAWQALMITAAGGLSLLAGLVLLGQGAGTWRLSALLADPSALDGRASGVALLLILGGAASKSALVPLHVWLPNAMTAPAPASAFLHAATMVKAGVFLLARLSPVLAQTGAWATWVTGLGAATAVVAAWMALLQADLKRLLAYTTISAVGVMTLALGLGGPGGARVALALFLAHALYKGALFLVAGSLEHAVGTRDLRALGGQARALPWTAAAALLATASMVGLPPTLGFVAEEELVALAERRPGGVILGAAVLWGTLYTAAGFVAGLRPFLGATPTPAGGHEGGPGWWAGPLALGVAGVALALGVGPLERSLLGPAVTAVAGATPEAPLALWHGLTPALAVSVAILVAGGALALAWAPLRAAALRLGALGRLGPDRLYREGERGLLRLGGAVERVFQHGSQSLYVAAVLGTALALATPAALRAVGPLPDRTPAHLADIGLAALILLAATGAVTSRSRIGALACTSLVGYGVGLLFAVLGGPDLAIVQLLVETLLAALVVLLLPAMPRLDRLATGGARARDAALSLATGALVTALLLAATALPPSVAVRDFYVANSEPLGRGRNVVNTILVNFRAVDTLGEITVLAAAAMGVILLLSTRQPTAVGAGTPRGSLVLRVAARVILPLLLLFALFLLLLGHHDPGGGFTAALVLAAALALFLFGSGRPVQRELLRVRPRSLLAVGLLVATASGVLGVVGGRPFLAARWSASELPVLGGLHLGTPLLFDVGVALTSAGALFVMLRTLEAHSPWRS